MAMQGAVPQDARGRRPDPPGRAGWTTRQWLRRATAGAITLLIVLGALGVWALHRSSTFTDAIVNRASPAYVQAVLLETALINQETGIRGYGLTGQPPFLTPYTDGLTQQKTATAQLRTLLAGDSADIAALDEVLARAGTWQEQIAQPIAQSPAGGPIALATERADEGVQLFNAVRTAATAEQNQLQAARAAARTSQRDAEDLCDWVFAAIAAVILLLATLVFEGLRRGVTTPLGRLSADARQVADGDLGHVIAPTGPPDLRTLAGDVEGMRQRLVAELDVSDRGRRRLDEQTAELRRSNTELEQFAYVASHDLQEPLRKVASFCQLLQRRYAGQLDERADQYIAFAVDGATRMQVLINDLLTFSRVGRVNTRLSTVDLERVFAVAVEAVSMAVAESGAQITHDPLPEVVGDATQLGMLVQNLLGNAVKFRSPDRPPQIHLSAERGEGRWNFAVADNGIGISPQYADRVFVIFQRLHTKESYPGTGIGLALCKKIVEFHGGTISVDPEHSPGTRIAFSLSDSGVPPGRSALADGSAGAGSPAGTAGVTPTAGAVSAAPGGLAHDSTAEPQP
ncbi:MAG TPA: ATP-binding protein [Actinocrinis sp.]|nr:ATP-binding protein [Actinocrinis sp.]